MTSATIHLQGIGRVAAVEAQDLRPGMILSWNQAPGEFQVLGIRAISAHYVELTEANRRTGEIYRRRLKKTKLVGAEWPRSRDQVLRGRRRSRARGRR